MAEEKKQDGTNDNELLDPNEFEEGEEGKKPDDKGGEPNEPNPDDSSKTKSEEELEKEKRAEFARKRREREAKEKEERERKAREEQIRREAATQAKLGLVKTNPWTNQPIVDEVDLENYEIMKALDDAGKDPLADFPNAIAERNRKKVAESKKAQDEATKVEKQQREEVDKLRAKYPDVNTKTLAEDPLFVEILDEKSDRWTLMEMYEEYIRRKGAGNPAKKPDGKDDKKIEDLSKGNKQPSSSGGNPSNSGQKKVADMTDEEFREYYRNKYKR